MDLYQFMSESPILTVLILWVFAAFIFKIWNRTMRALNINKHGWPPPHCDGDGDFLTPDEDE